MADVKKDDCIKPPAVSGNKNPFEQFADRTDSMSLLGTLLKFSKGDYLVGFDSEDCPVTELVAIVPGLTFGWVRWDDNSPAEHEMGLVADGFMPPAREDLSHTDPAQWDVDDNGKPCDPWRKTNYLPMITVDGDTVYTFATSSDGGRRYGVAPLNREYGNHIRTNPDELPVVGLERDSYLHSNRNYGRIKYPVFPVKRWVKADVYLAAVQTLTGRTLKLLLPA
jgi:hypothetical protein